jgi:hypothetical protein
MLQPNRKDSLNFYFSLRRHNLHVNQFNNNMKKFLFLLIFLPSCEKVYCWDCELTRGHRTIPMPWVYTKTQIVHCHKSEKEINQIILDNKYQGNSSTSYMTCTKR